MIFEFLGKFWIDIEQIHKNTKQLSRSKSYHKIGGNIFCQHFFRKRNFGKVQYFFNFLGENGKIPIMTSVWFPLIILLILCTVGSIRVNEK